MKPAKKSASIVAICAIVAFTSNRSAAEIGFKTIGDLRANCQLVDKKWEALDVQEMIQITDCRSFLNGVAELMMTLCRSDDMTVPSVLKAAPNHTMRALAQGFLNWADEHPNRWSEARGLGIYEAISTQFPCES